MTFSWVMPATSHHGCINGNSGKDYLLLDGTMQDYTFAVSKRGVTITNSAGEVDTVKNVEVFHFSDGTNYLVGRHGLVQTSDQNINKFLADSGVDQSYFSAVPTAGTHVQAAASNARDGSSCAAAGFQYPKRERGRYEHDSDEPGHGPQNHGPFAGFAASDQLATIFGQALNQTGHPQGVEKLSATRLSGTQSMPRQTTQRMQTAPWLI